MANGKKSKLQIEREKNIKIQLILACIIIFLIVVIIGILIRAGPIYKWNIILIKL